MIGNFNLMGVLMDKASEQYTGIVQVSYQGSASCSYAEFVSGDLFVIQNGKYGINRILEFICKYCGIRYWDAIIEYVNKRLSGYGKMAILKRLCQTGLLKLDGVRKALSLLNVMQIERSEGSVVESVLECEHSAESTTNGFLFPVSHIKDCLLERQKRWDCYGGLKRWLESIDKGTLTESSEGHPSLNWVNGERGIIEIATLAGCDPLDLLEDYDRWIKSGDLRFRSAITHVQKPKILVVDDSPITRTMLKRYLGSHYEVIVASNVPEAMEFLDKEAISLIISDISMPDVDGWQFCRMVKRMEKSKEIPIIFLTAKNSIIDRTRVQFSGASRYLVKPVTEEELLQVVSEYV
jgi:twitching motility two-component system response regulator PilG